MDESECAKRARRAHEHAAVADAGANRAGRRARGSRARDEAVDRDDNRARLLLAGYALDVCRRVWLHPGIARALDAEMADRLTDMQLTVWLDEGVHPTG